MSRVGFVGLGNIGFPMAKRVLDAGHDLFVHDLHIDAAKPLVDSGAVWTATLEQLASEVTFVLLSLPGPSQVEEVLLGDRGLFAGARDDQVVVDLSTNSLALVRRLAARAVELEIAYLDAPVSGGGVGATAGTLSVMVGGDASAFQRVKLILQAFSSKIFYLGEAGTGTVAKLVNNQIYLCSSILLQEGLVFASKAGLHPTKLIEALRSSAAAPYLGMVDRIVGREFSNTFFSLGLGEKDLSLFLEGARSLCAPMPVTAAAHQLYLQGVAAGNGGENFYATVKAIEDAAGTRVP